MNINSENIQKKEFHIVFKGYKPEEVDKFLDLLSIEFNKLQKRVGELEENVDSIKYEGDQESVKMKRVIQEALVSAHKVAEEIKQKAKTEAEELVNQRRIDEEQAIRKIRTEKEMLQQNIARLKEDYNSFKSQISKFADDFKQKTLSIGDIQLDDTLKKIDIASEKISTNEEADISEEEDENTQDNVAPEDEGAINSFMDNKEEYKHAKKELIEESKIQGDDSDHPATLSDDIIEKMNYQGIGDPEEDKEDDLEKSESPDIEKENVISKDNDEEGEKKTRKKIDIANPDIINDFFKTDED